MAQWYKKALQFLPVQLLFVKVKQGNSSDLDLTLLQSSAWISSVVNFLTNHPAPNQKVLEEVRKASTITANAEEHKINCQLVQRYQFFPNTTMQSPRKVPLILIYICLFQSCPPAEITTEARECEVH